MVFDFDEIVDRRGTGCLKYDFAAEHGRPADVLPLWVADMDFRTAPGIIEALKKEAASGIYGYSDVKDDYFEAVSGWYRKHFDWTPQKEWLVRTPGVVFAIAAAIRAFTAPGEAVLLQQPVYHPFGQCIRGNGRRVVSSSLVLRNGHYEIDFDELEQKIIRHRIRLFLLCSPHNPVGRVWMPEELKRIGEICLAHGTVLLSDEIHSDFTYPGHTHHTLLSVDPAFAQNTIVCTAPSKTFNLAGLQISNLFIPEPELRRRLLAAVAETGYGVTGVFGLVGAKAAYETGEEWYLQLKDYLYGNLCFFRRFLEERLPELRLIEPEGTYLLWVDFRGLRKPDGSPLSEEEREELLLNRAKLWLDSGRMFGSEGEGFERFNIACPRAVLRQALEQLERALHE